MTREILTPEHFGFCEGVIAADQLLRNVAIAALETGIDNVYGYHDIVHNETVINEHEKQGVVFINNPEDAPNDSIVVLSAHGTAPKVQKSFIDKGCLTLDGACPLVIHTHKAVQKARRDNAQIIYITGNRDHDEVLGTIGHMDTYIDGDGELVEDPIRRVLVTLEDDPTIIAKNLQIGVDSRIVSQTTLDDQKVLHFREELKKAILLNNSDTEVSMSKKSDVCSAVRDRQDGVRVTIANMKRAVMDGEFIVVTDPSSKNGMGYVALAKTIVNKENLPIRVHSVRSAEDLPKDLNQNAVFGLTASASTPDRDIYSTLGALGADEGTLPAQRRGFSLFYGNTKMTLDNLRGIIEEWKEGGR